MTNRELFEKKFGVNIEVAPFKAYGGKFALLQLSEKESGEILDVRAWLNKEAAGNE
jgi:hypothetical protein